jgi:hypothetical protein
MSSGLYQYSGCALSISGPQVFVSSSAAVFTHMSPQGSGLPIDLQGGGVGDFWIRAE